jgi:aminoglycoside 2''-phosphotransferase
MGVIAPRKSRYHRVGIAPPLSELKEAVRAAWPERRLRRIRVRDSGWANLVLEADDRVIFRLPRKRDVTESLGFEVRVLELIFGYVTIPMSIPERLSVLRRPKGWPFMAYPKLPGIPLSEVQSIDFTGKRRLGEFLGILLEELESVPPPSMLRIRPQAGNPQVSDRRYRRLRRRFREVAEPIILPSMRRAVLASFDRFYQAIRGAHYRPVAAHMDLGAYNIKWDRASNRPTGVIDWEDARLGDPAFDLTGLTFLGDAKLHALEDSRRAAGDSTYEQGLEFYRQMSPVHDFVNAATVHNVSMMRKYAAQLNSQFQKQSTVPWSSSALA